MVTGVSYSGKGYAVASDDWLDCGSIPRVASELSHLYEHMLFAYPLIVPYAKVKFFSFVCDIGGTLGVVRSLLAVL